MSEFDSPLVNADGAIRLRRFATATLASFAVVTAVTTILMASLAPGVDTWAAAVGLGAMIGFWTSPLLGAVIGNGYHEILKDRAEAQAAAPTPTGAPASAPASGPIPLPAAG